MNLLSKKFALPQNVFDILLSLSLDGTIQIDNFSDNPRWMVTAECNATLNRLDEDNFKIKILVGVGKANMTIEILREQLIPKSFYPFFSQMDFDSYKRIWEISIIETTDQMDTVRRNLSVPSRTSVSVDKVIAVIQTWSKFYGMQVIGVGDNWLTISLEKLPNDLTKFVESEVFLLCPHFADLTEEEYYPNFSAMDKFRSSLYYHRIVELKWN